MNLFGEMIAGSRRPVTTEDLLREIIHEAFCLAAACFDIIKTTSMEETCHHVERENCRPQVVITSPDTGNTATIHGGSFSGSIGTITSNLRFLLLHNLEQRENHSSSHYPNLPSHIKH